MPSPIHRCEHRQCKERNDSRWDVRALAHVGVGVAALALAAICLDQPLRQALTTGNFDDLIHYEVVTANVTGYGKCDIQTYSVSYTYQSGTGPVRRGSGFVNGNSVHAFQANNNTLKIWNPALGHGRQTRHNGNQARSNANSANASVLAVLHAFSRASATARIAGGEANRRQIY